MLGVSAPPLALGLTLQSVGGKSLAVVTLGHDAPPRANAAPFLHEQHAAKKIGLYVEPIEAAHVARRINAAKMQSGHGRILCAAILLCTRKPHRFGEAPLWNLSGSHLELRIISTTNIRMRLISPLLDNLEKMAGKNDKPRGLLGVNPYIPMTRWVLRIADSTGE